ncbi:MAG TPA: hypothetical protein VLE73_00540 [Candidatus Saccharimonadales bacterium]|nr:hypothetical protein [Candidatus Saccharimonadales bacterium]
MSTQEPTTAAVNLWLQQINIADAHETGWIAMNSRFHGVTRAMRPYTQARYASSQERQAAFDGLTLALLALSHFADVHTAQKLLRK